MLIMWQASFQVLFNILIQSSEPKRYGLKSARKRLFEARKTLCGSS